MSEPLFANVIAWYRSSQNHQASTNYKEAFALFDKRGNGRVALQSLGDLLRACGQNPTLAEIKDLEKGVGGDCESARTQSLRNEAQHLQVLANHVNLCWSSRLRLFSESSKPPRRLPGPWRARRILQRVSGVR